MAQVFQRAKTAFDILFHPDKYNELSGYFGMLNGYSPIWSTYDGGVYEMELTRSCIHTFATHVSKLQVNTRGSALAGIGKTLSTKPNYFMATPQFLYKVATIYEAQNTCFIVPILDEFDRTVGLYPVNPMMVEIVTYENHPEPFIKYSFADGNKKSIEFSRCGILSKFLYNSDVMGESNQALDPTLQLLHMQNQGIKEGIKNGASFRFLAQAANLMKDSDLEKKRANFVKNNFGTDAGTLLLFPADFANVKQVTSRPQVVDSEQMKLIQNRCFDYYNTNEKILQNTATPEEWASYYEGKIEPFATMVSQIITNMLTTERERAVGNEFLLTANRLQFMSNSDKLNFVQQMFDRGIISTDQAMDVWGLPHVEGGDKRYIRKEYTEVSQLGAEAVQTEVTAGEPSEVTTDE